MTDLDGATSAALKTLEAQFPPGTGIVLIIQPPNEPSCTRVAHNSNDDQVLELLRALGQSTRSEWNSCPAHKTIQ